MALLLSCNARLDDDARALFKTRVVDVNGDPVANCEVIATNYPAFNRYSLNIEKFSRDDDQFILGKGITDNNGQVEFTMLVDGGLFVNMVKEEAANYGFQVARQEQIDYSVIIPETIFKETATVEIDFINTSLTTERYGVSFDFESNNCISIYNNGIFEIESDCYNEFNTGTFNNSANDGLFVLQVLYPSTIQLEYASATGNLIETTFDVSTPNARYEIFY
jgi:hypothetical protein